MFNINLKYRFLIILTFCVQAVSAQVIIDTIGTTYERVIKNNELYYTYQDTSDQLVELKYTSPMSTMILDGYIRSLTGAIPVQNDHNYFLKGGQIVDRTMKKVCDPHFDKIYGKVGENFIGSKKDSCFLLFENCEMKFLAILSFDFRIEYSKSCTHFFFRDRAKNILYIFDSTGNEISQIEGYEYTGSFDVTSGIIQGELGVGTSQWENVFYDYNGQLIAKGGYMLQNREVTILKKEGHKDKYYFKDREIPIPEEIQEVTLLRALKYVKIELKNGNIGLLSNSLERTIIPPKYKVIEYSHYIIVGANIYCEKPKNNGFIYALDAEKKLSIFDLDGEEIKLEVDIYFPTLEIINPIRIMKLKDNLSFYVIHNKPDNIFYIFDKEWNFIATEKREPTDYYFLSASNEKWFLVPTRVLKYFSGEIDENDFFKVWGNSTERNNIIDSNLQLVYKDDIGTVRKINSNHFILNYGNSYDIDDRILVKFSKQ